jgi:hypothetical protein
MEQRRTNSAKYHELIRTHCHGVVEAETVIGHLEDALAGIEGMKANPDIDTMFAEECAVFVRDALERAHSHWALAEETISRRLAA